MWEIHAPSLLRVPCTGCLVWLSLPCGIRSSPCCSFSSTPLHVPDGSILRLLHSSIRLKGGDRRAQADRAAPNGSRAEGCRTTGTGFALSVTHFLSSSRVLVSRPGLVREQSFILYPGSPDLVEVGRDAGKTPQGPRCGQTCHWMW